MNIETINCLVSVMALIVSIVALAKSCNSKKIANDIQMASLEIEIRRMIEDSKNEMNNLAKENSVDSLEKNDLILQKKRMQILLTKPVQNIWTEKLIGLDSQKHIQTKFEI